MNRGSLRPFWKSNEIVHRLPRSAEFRLQRGLARIYTA
jgi:hypothetical protein